VERLTVRRLVADGTDAIASSRAVDHWLPSLARYDSEELMSAALGSPLTAQVRGSVPAAAQRRRFASMIARRVRGEPVAQITGRFPFRGLDLRVRPDVFAPRASSEHLAAEAIAFLRRRAAPRIAVDVASGSGPIALAIAHEVRSSQVWGLDISREAVLLCRANARRVGIGGVRFLQSDLLSALPRSLMGRVDVLTIHPPYVARQELRTLPREIRDFEPVHTLSDGSSDGLELVRRIAGDATSWLARAVRSTSRSGRTSLVARRRRCAGQVSTTCAGAATPSA
jgi:release factor glutamine methyltransferase